MYIIVYNIVLIILVYKISYFHLNLTVDYYPMIHKDI